MPGSGHTARPAGGVPASTDTVVFDGGLIARYDRRGPRYTSYPPATRFHDGVGERDFRRAAGGSNAALIPRPLSVYVHIPFCDTVCFYCACSRIVTANRSRAVPYLEALRREVAMKGALFDRDRVVDQLHLGGGTPTFLTREQLRALMRAIGEHLRLRDDDGGEYSIEIDPRRADELTLAALRDMGFNRLSFGVQDFDLEVQHAVNRIQPETLTRRLVTAARREGYRSLNADLIYGLPRQSARSFAATLDTLLDMELDRVSVFNYAHLPQRFKTQRRIDEAELPGPREKLAILELTVRKLTAAGYVYIGMDHFARPDDELACAQRGRTLHRNFQGFSTRAECDLVAFGVTGIGKVGDLYVQNESRLDAWARRVGEGAIPIARGYELDEDDRIRADAISELICHGELSARRFAARHGVDIASRFARELEALAPMVGDGLVEVSAEGVKVTPLGRLLVRNVCMVFDAHLPERESGFSRVI